MLKLVSISGIIFMGVAFTFPAFAQSNVSQETYLQQTKKAMTNSVAQAQKQFDKTYPKPPPPVIPSPNVPPSVLPATPPKPKNMVPSLSDDNTNTNPQPVMNPPPDININTGKNPQGQSSGQQNIFMPPSSSANNTSSSAPNPYR